MKSKNEKLKQLDQELGIKKPSHAKRYEKLCKMIDEYMDSIECDDALWREQVLYDFALYYLGRLKNV